MMLRVAKLVGCWLLCTGVIFAQETEDQGVEYPLQVIHFAGVDRLQKKADALFAAGDRPEMSDIVTGWMDNSLKGLEGMDRTKPFGMMLYIKPGLAMGIAGISYIPATDVDKLLTTLAGKGTVNAVTGKTDRWELTKTGWSPAMEARRIGNYIFLAGRNDASELDRKFPNPERMVSKLTTRYDAAYSLMLKNIPPSTKKIFLEFFKNSALAGLQQRDEEPDAAYRIRRASGESLIDLLDRVVMQGEDLTVGAFVDPEKRDSILEIELNGTKDSKLAQFFQDMAGRRSHFTPLFSQPATFTLSTSMQLDEKQRKPFVELFNLLPDVIENERAKREANLGENEEFAENDFFKGLTGSDAGKSALGPLLKTFLSSAEQGQFDMFAQIKGDEPGQYSLIAGSRVIGGQKFPQQLTDLLTYIKGNGTSLPGINNLEVSARMIGEYPVHVAALPEPPDDMGKTMFGLAPNLYVYATPQAMWFAFGGDAALTALESDVKRLAEASAKSESLKVNAPFQLITYSRQWVNAALTPEHPEGADEDFEILDQTFKAENDRLLVEGRPTDRGLRIRFELQAGYAAWVGRQIARQMSEAIGEQ